MLVRALVAVDRGDRHVCSIVRVPTIEEEDARRSHRERQRLIRERTAHINRIKGLFFGQGIRGIEPLRKRSRVNLSEIRTAEGLPLPARLRAEIEREFSRFDHVEEQLKAVEAERDTADAQNPAVNKKREMLIRLRGLGPASAAILSREVFGRSFANRKQLGSYLGLTPSAYDSGSSTRCQGISKSGNRHARHMMIEVAWLWLKYQPQSALAKWFAQRAAGQSPRIRRIMLIALARKLIVSLWHYVEAGIVPEGAVSVVEGAATA
jgi:transposase